MMYLKVFLTMFVLLYIVYYIILFGHIFGLWHITYERITFKGILIPFYYLNKIKNY